MARDICWCCQTHAPVDSHHLSPLEFGGAKDGPQVLICKNCHASLDYCAKHTAKTGVISYPSHLTSTDGKDRFAKMLKIMFQTQREFNKTGAAPDARRRLVVHLSEEEQKKVHALRDIFGQTSIEKTILALINTVYARETGKPRI